MIDGVAFWVLHGGMHISPCAVFDSSVSYLIESAAVRLGCKKFRSSTGAIGIQFCINFLNHCFESRWFCQVDGENLYWLKRAPREFVRGWRAIGTGRPKSSRRKICGASLRWWRGGGIDTRANA